MKHNTLFISDLHLSGTAKKTTELFAEFMAKITEQTDALYILGDLFQFWVGDDNYSSYNKNIKNILRSTSNKIPVYLMPGNRDFLLGEEFAKETGCTLIPDPYSINLYGQKTLLTHGDTLCTREIKYQIFRKIIRFPYGIKIFLKIPLKKRIWFARRIQKFSSRIHSVKGTENSGIQSKDIQNLLSKLSQEQLIHGHTHIMEVDKLVLNDKKNAKRFSLGEWADGQGSTLVYHDDHSFEFKIM